MLLSDSKQLLGFCQLVQPRQ